MELDSNEKYQIYKDFPLPLSIAKIENNKINYLIVSDGFCKLFNVNYDKAISILNNDFSSKIMFEDDYFLINEIQSYLIENKINNFNIILRLKVDGNRYIKLLNIVGEKKGDNYLFLSFNDVSRSQIHNVDLKKYIQNQQTLIAEQSQKAIIIVSKNDFSLLYYNNVANKLFDIEKKAIKNLKCFELLNENHKCLYCPLENERFLNNSVELKLKNTEKTYKINIAKTIWNDEEAYIEYFLDISKEKQYNHLYNLFKSLVSYKRNAETKVGSLFCFDVETSKVLFYFLNATSINFDNKNFSYVIDSYYPFIYGEEDKKRFKEFFNFEKITKNKDINSTDSLDYHQKINNEVLILRATYNFLEDPTTNKKLLIINVYNISERFELEKMIDALVNYQNEIVVRQDNITNEMIVFARKDNFLTFPVGFSRYTYKEFEDYIHKRLNVLKIHGDKSIFTYYQSEKKIKKENYSTTYAVDINGEARYKRSLCFKDSENSFFTVIYDVTDLALKERKKNKQLLKINKDLQFAKKEAIKANKAKSEFLSRMSHDMRTPLGAIINLSKFGVEDSINDEIIDYFSQITENSKYLLSLVNDILDFQKIENNFVELHNDVVKFGETSKSIEQIVRLKAKEKNINFILNKEKDINELFFKIDIQRMKQLLVNILNNAIKYTPKGGTIKWDIKVTSDENNNPIVVHTIEDNGVGMSKSFQKSMYEPFTKEYNELTDAEGGSGLGLVIVKKIVDSMKGNIQCESQLNKGTKFTIKLPRTIPTQVEINRYLEKLTHKRPLIDLKNVNILVCEDVEINQKIIKKILEDRNALVSIVDNGLKGIKLFKEKSFDLVIMDVRMPFMNGLEATKEIRKIDKNVPIIGLSANAYSQDKLNSISSGMDEYLSKPIDKEELYRVLSKLLRNI